MTAEVTKAARLVARAAAGSPGAEVPRRVCAAVREGLGVDGATLSLLTDTPSRQLLAASDDAALQLEEIQFTVAEGPCVSAARTGEPVAVNDLRHELTPWPLFGAMTREKLPEVRSVYALPLFFGDYVLGSVDLLATRPGALDEEALEQAADVADAVTAALMPTREMLLTGNEAPAWEPEPVVRAHWFDTWRAVGALAARRRVTPEDALALLRAEAFRTGRSLPDITTDILRDPPGTS
ncbi:GAF and ANTAR domain-containing protein [Streptomyces sp. JB150]|uniref:GAF and ANTAR domain-containing protein n=1 Tax=Streptomyces sp. JB150 TaxID=2714844 RepID=UPI001407888A|nr:GAF and ANTAR domain-containing protein [Streptomyces sp. JB150]QIJ61104.1 GAF and ANTAR domain-containing protein [Streptomyces sp. JB150]